VPCLERPKALHGRSHRNKAARTSIPSRRFDEETDVPHDHDDRAEPNERDDMPEHTTLARINSPLMLGGKGRWSTAQRRPQAAFTYDRKTVVLHWCTAVLVGALWLIAQIIDDFPAGALRVDARSVHISLGLALAVVLAIRVTWRNGSAGALSPVRSGRMDRAAAIGHWSLYALAILAVILGIANALARGENIFNLFALPDLAHGDREIRKLVGTLHGWVANALVILSVGHALLALFHHYILRDGVLRRMVPARWFARPHAASLGSGASSEGTPRG
jgi:cytochrome b561